MSDFPVHPDGISTTRTIPPQILLGTVAIEPTRWARLTPGSDPASAPPPIVLADWMDTIEDAGFDGIEVWESHLLACNATDRQRVLGHDLPVEIWNSYVSLDDEDPARRVAIGAAASDAGATGIKFNVGNDDGALEAYGERIAGWLETLPASVRLLCECHHDISIAERPDVAAAIFERSGPASHVQAIVHTHESDDGLRARFDAYGDRITHVHVNFLDFETMLAPRLTDVADQLASSVEFLTSLGFTGTYTIEFCHGLLTADDHPDYLLSQAADDLATLRQIVNGARR